MEERLRAVSEVLAGATRSASQLPSSTDLEFHASIDPELTRSLGTVAEAIGSMLRTMQRWARPGEGDADEEEEARAYAARVTAPGAFAGAGGELTDELLERVDTFLDEYAGRVELRRPEGQRTDRAASPGDELPRSGPLPAHILDAPMTPPQRHFTTRPDNRADVPWSRPLRLGKPNAKVPIGWRDPAWGVPEGATVRGMYSTEGDPRLNPYHVEITSAEPPRHALERPAEPLEPPIPLQLHAAGASSAESPFTWVADAAALDALLAHLLEDRVEEIAVDLEHHSTHSYQGIVCLMQISTRWGDYILDTLADEVRERAEVLNRAFTHPDKVLVLHGADHDVLWLQRDLGLYVTNLFDTFHASKALQFGAHSLASLLLRYTAFEADKRWQLADWRIRPLPDAMLFYARNDTHSLLYVYDRLRSELQAQGGPRAVRDVFERSKATATKTYAKEPWDASGDSRGGWRTLWLRRGGELARGSEPRPVPLMGREERLTRRLHQWRDGVAREEDESPNAIMPPHTLMHLAFRAPTTELEVRRCFPHTALSVRRRAAELAQVVADELRAWLADADQRKAAAQAQLQALDAGAPDDTGIAVDRAGAAIDAPGADIKSAPRRVQPALWEAPADAALLAPGPSFLASLAAPRSKRTLFDAPPAGPARLAQIRHECAEVISGMFGSAVGALQRGAPVSALARMMGLGSSGAAGEGSGEPAGSPPADAERADARAKAEPAEAERALTPPAAPAESKRSADDGIVQVSKKPRWTKEMKRKRKEAAATAAVEPFDYSSTPSVLEQPAGGEAEPRLLPQQRPDAPKRPKQGKQRAAKQRSDMRSGNKSGTFAR